MIKDILEYKNVSHKDNRGVFTRIYDKKIMSHFVGEVCQVNLSENPFLHTLRGLHFQINRRSEHKIIKILNGSVFLAIVDLREDSESYSEVYERYLSATDEVSIFVPAGCATGWLTIEENTNLIYLMFDFYNNCEYSGLRFDDPTLNISWPFQPKIISQKDLLWNKLKLCNP